VVASSMPVRDVETFFPSRPDPPRVLSNRGANGIDGTLSTAFGVAAAGDGPVVCLLGDVALLHDVGGLAAATRVQGARLTIVLLDNDGGGIFSFLPVAGVTEPAGAVEQLIDTPHGLELRHAAALFGLGWEEAGDASAFRAALARSLADGGRSTIIRVRTDRAENVALHRAVWAAVASARDER
jgi:2-succinyl-5-enolpyruvyl-6-hydroxy-3-cyclohexene-1-carboxylate synthase